jgi:putative ABC transport system permease protein
MRDTIRMILVGGPWQTADAEPVGADVVMVSGACLRTLGNPVLRGRSFTDRDRPGAPRVAAVNETAARTFFGDRDPLGQPLFILQALPSEPPFEVVAVVRDVPTTGLGSDVRPQVYLPLAQALTDIRGVTRSVSVALRTAIDPASLGAALRSAVWELDDQLAVSNVETMEQVVTASLRPQRFQAVLLVVFSALALVLAAVGLYGLMAHLVGLRRRELGIRLAMGAGPGQLLSLVLGQALGLAGLGVALGILGAVLGARLLEGMVFGISTSDPASLAGTAGVLLVAAAAASAIPARRASRVDPREVLPSQ